jgi:hypothetical protein
MKSTRTLLITAAAIIIGLVILSSLGKKPPFIPADSIHSAAATQESCTACHAPGKETPLKANHPPKEQCLVCHKRKAS